MTKFQELQEKNVTLSVTPQMLKDFLIEVVTECRKSPNNETLYTPQEFADLLKISQTTIWRWVRDGQLKQTVLGTKIYYKLSDLKKK